MRMIKILFLSLVFSSGLSYGEEVLRLADSFVSFKQGILLRAGLSHFLSENQNCEMRGTVGIKPEEDFDRGDGSVFFKVQPNSSFSSSLNRIPFWGHAYPPDARDLEKSYEALISGGEPVEKSFHQNETDGEITDSPYDYRIMTEPVEGAEWEASSTVPLYKMDGSWQSAFSSGSLTGGQVIKGIEVKTFHEVYQALSQGLPVYLMEPLGGGGGGGGSHLQVVRVLLSHGNYLESDEALYAGMVMQPVQKSVKYPSDSLQDGSSTVLPAVQCSQP